MADPKVSIAAADPTSEESTQLIRELYMELGARYGDAGLRASEPGAAQVPRSAFVEARLEGQPVGCGALRPHVVQEPRIAEIGRMLVRPQARGRGVSKSILERLEDPARGFGYTTIRLETGLLQPEAIHLYLKAGHTRIARYGIYNDNSMSACFEKKPGA